MLDKTVLAQKIVYFLYCLTYGDLENILIMITKFRVILASFSATRTSFHPGH